MEAANKTPHILIINPSDDASLRASLEDRYGVVVNYLGNEPITLEMLREVNPDLIVLDAGLTDPPAWTLLAELSEQAFTPPVVLIGANGRPTRNDFNYANIMGWINPPFTVDELADFILAVLEQPQPAQELVLAKRAELIEANQELIYRLQELQTLFEIGKSVTSLLDLGAVLRLVVKSAVDLTQAEEGYLLLVDEASGNLYLRAEANLDKAEAKDFWVKVNDPISGQVIQTGQPILISQNQHNLKVKTGLIVHSLVNVPVTVRQKVIGVLGVNNRREPRGFTLDDQELLSALADWAAIAIQNARLYAATREVSRNLRLTNEVSRLVSSTLDVEQIPRLLVRRTAEIFEAECGSLALIDQEKENLVFQVAYDSQGQEIKTLRNFLMPLGQGIMGQVAATGRPRIVNDVEQESGWWPMVDQLTGFKTKQVIAVPLITESETLGVIELLNKKEGDFSRSDLELLSLVAASAAIALKNARQYAALKKANEALNQAQAQQIAAERWTVLGKASGNLAHRINNSTALVPIAAQRLRELLQPVAMPTELKTEVEANLGRIERNTLYTINLAMALLRRFRKNPAEAHHVNQLIEQALKLIDIPQNIRIVCHLDPNLPAIKTSDLLVDVFVELITNAVRVMNKTGGVLRLASFQMGDNLVVQITDSGPGIPETQIKRIFDMFYTTNPQGLGFGLWWVKTFLEQQRGQITVDSRMNEGTTFTIILPQNLPATA